MQGKLFKSQSPPMKLRYYQEAAINAVYEHLRSRDDNPLVVIPTAGGKTPVMSSICRDAVNKWHGRVLILAHVKELLQQTAETLEKVAPDLEIGIYSAGLKSRDTKHPVIVAGIQSVYKRACELDKFDLIIIDEAHMIPLDGEGMYRQFLADAKIINPLIRVIGLTATPYRLKAGMIAQDDHFLNSICYEVGVKDLIDDGFLCPLKSKAGRSKAKLDNLHIRGGEFINSEVESAMDSYSLVQSACDEIADLTKDRNKVLIFTASVKHGSHVCETLQRQHNIECGFVTGDTPGLERESLLHNFKNGDLKFLANVNVLTTGFDAPNIDCVVLLRPTNSPGLYYQMVGRGFRLHPSKEDCLVLDYGGNILRHGPVDDLQIKTPGQSAGEAPAKECPECLSLIHASYAKCPDCGYEFPPPEKETHQSQASTAGILTGQVDDTEYDVLDVSYSVHTKKNADPDHPRTMRIQYCTGFNSYVSEWVCPEHTGYARNKFEKWWSDRSHESFPNSAMDAVELANNGALAEPTSITVRSVTGQKFDRVIGYELSEIPPCLDGSDERELVTAGDSEPEWYDEDEIPF